MESGSRRAMLAGGAVAALALTAAWLWPERDGPVPAPPPGAAAEAAAAGESPQTRAAAAPPVTAPPPRSEDAPAPRPRTEARSDDTPAPAPAAPPAPPDLAGGALEPDAAPTRELVVASLRAAVERELPGHKLSSDQYDTLADAVLAMRAAREALRSLPADAAHAEQARALREQLGQAAADFEYVLEMSPAEFTELANSGAGVDTDDGAIDPAVDPDTDGEDAPREPVYLHELSRD